jgi:hypothetical protein
MLAAHSLINIATNKIGQNFTPRIGDLWQDLSSYSIYSIAKGKDLSNNDIFTASANNGYLLYSYDAKNWAIADAGNIFSSASTEVARAIAYNASLKMFVAVGGNNVTPSCKMAYSYDGKKWTSINVSAFSTVYLRCVAVGASNIFVAGGDGNGYALSSTDGINWSIAAQFHPSTIYIPRAIIYAPTVSLYLVATQQGNVLTSPNLITWTVRTAVTGGTIYAIAYDGSTRYIIAGAADSVYLTTTGTSYIRNRTPATDTEVWWNVIYFNSYYIAIGTNNLTTYSVNAATYTLGNSTSNYSSNTLSVFTAPASTNTLYTSAITNYNGSAPTLIITGDSGNALSSTNGTSWTRISEFFKNYTILGMTYGNNKFLVSGTTNGLLASSKDGVTWDRVTSFLSLYIRSIGYSNGLFYVAYQPVGNSSVNSIKYSSDFVTWTNVTINGSATTSTETQIYWIGNLNGKTYLCGDDGKIYSAADNVTFTSNSIVANPVISNTKYLDSMVYGNYIYLATCSECIFYSYDGFNWTKLAISITTTVTANYQFESITFGNGMFVACGYNDFSQGRVFLYSTDGINWNVQYSSEFTYSDIFNQITFVENRFVAIGYKGTGNFEGIMAISYDGLNWTKVNSLIVANQLHSITYGNKMLLIGGSSGLVLTSP